MHIARVDPLAQRPERHGAVHRSGIDVSEPEPSSQPARDRALSRPGRSINRHYYDPLCHVLIGRITADMRPDEFDRLVETAYRRIPGRFRKRLQNIAIVVEPEPSESQLARGRVGAGGTLLGLYEGRPLT